MTYMVGGNARIKFVMLVAAAMTVGICGDAVAKVHKGRLHAQSFTSKTRRELVLQEPVRPEPMRYYGGPKSPMWREVR
jgi:hypothetical protein